MAGVPFDPIDQLATPGVSSAARELLINREQLAAAKSEARVVLKTTTLSDEQSRAWNKAIRHGNAPPVVESAPPALNRYSEAVRAVVMAEAELDKALQLELEASRHSLVAAVRKFLPGYLVFAGTDIGERLLRQVSTGPELPPRNKDARARERTAILYLQRIAAKNDSLSAFGPCGWGRVVSNGSGVQLTPKPGIADRDCFLERWTALGTAAAINRDAEARLEVAPRIHPNGRIENDRFVFADTGESIALDEKMIELLRRCDGTRPAHSLGADIPALHELVEKKILRWELEVPALDPYAFEMLVHDVLQWRDTPARQRWLDQLNLIAELPSKFRQTEETESRAAIMHEAGSSLDQLGARHAASGRFLYAATNPIGEECLRETNFAISQSLLDEISDDAAPWIDLWRDCYAFVAGRVAAGLRQVFESSGKNAVPLPAFLKLCENAKLPLTGPGLVALAHIAFQEVKAAFNELMAGYADKPEHELTADDCRFVRRRFKYSKFDEYTYPSADLQLAASSVEAVRRGDYQWILAELHPPVALLHHGFYWSCPDKAALTEALSKTVCARPNFFFGFFAADFTATTSVRIFDALPELTWFVAPKRANSNWRRIPPAETEVYVDQQSGDVCLRRTNDQQYLGSFARAWLIPLGFHPFQFGMTPHMPRLRCGRVIVQRRAWTITLEELGQGDFSGISRDLVLAVEQLRARRDLPRFIYIRPTEQALRRSGAEGRDKDTKPVFIDLESYLFIELFHRWLTKAGELEATEMLPTPDQLLWQEADGRRTFELRTQIIPRA
jgi:hypothetical protein